MRCPVDFCVVNADNQVCLRCGACVALCPTEALVLLRIGLVCDASLCNLCEDCVAFCPVPALEMTVA
ncbi:MAG: 4Fe-4S binding protein [Candidatus Zixiibacteriota bacterium]|nr:MAG: 4Fe-4S binding protein [candidate division Zixibacteria bacterium]